MRIIFGQTGQRGILFHMMSCSVYKLGGVGQGAAIAQEQAAYHSSDAEQFHLCITCFIYIIIVILCSFYFPILYLNSQVLLFLPLFHMPWRGRGEVSGWLSSA